MGFLPRCPKTVEIAGCSPSTHLLGHSSQPFSSRDFQLANCRLRCCAEVVRRLARGLLRLSLQLLGRIGRLLLTLATVYQGDTREAIAEQEARDRDTPRCAGFTRPRGRESGSSTAPRMEWLYVGANSQIRRVDLRAHVLATRCRMLLGSFRKWRCCTVAVLREGMTPAG